jgi:hypothetical protein
MLKALAGILLIAGVLYSAWAALSRRSEPAAPITRQSKPHALESRGQGLKFPRIDEKHSGDSSECPWRHPAALC